MKLDDRFWFWLIFGMAIYGAIAGNDISNFVCAMVVLIVIEYWAKKIIKVIEGNCDE